MNRRTWLIGIGAASLAGCVKHGDHQQRSPSPVDEAGDADEPVPMSDEEFESFQAGLRREKIHGTVQAAIEAEAPTVGFVLVPILVAALVSYLVQIMGNCLLKNVLAQHRAINRNPTGSMARTWKEHVATAFQEKNPLSDQSDVTAHVTAAFEAFRNASREDVTQAVQQASQLPQDADWGHAANTADKLKKLMEC